MKTRAIIIIIWTAAVLHVMARFVQPFQGWDDLIRKSPDIIIARCEATPTVGMEDFLVESRIQVMSSLKGRTNTDGSNMISSCWPWPRQAEYYLVFSFYHDGIYQANEAYMVVPLGLWKPVEFAAGTTLEAKVKTLIQHRLTDLNFQMGQEQEEKERLEEPFGPFNLSEYDVRNASGLADRWRHQSDPVSAFLWSGLPTSSQNLLAKYDQSDLDSIRAEGIVRRALNKAISGPCIFENERFKGVSLRPETAALLRQNPTGAAVTRVNRLLLEDAYPVEVSRDQPHKQ